MLYTGGVVLVACTLVRTTLSSRLLTTHMMCILSIVRVKLSCWIIHEPSIGVNQLWSFSLVPAHSPQSITLLIRRYMRVCNSSFLYLDTSVFEWTTKLCIHKSYYSLEKQRTLSIILGRKQARHSLAAGSWLSLSLQFCVYLTLQFLVSITREGMCDYAYYTVRA